MGIYRLLALESRSCKVHAGRGLGKQDEAGTQSSAADDKIVIALSREHDSPSGRGNKNAVGYGARK